MESRGVLYFIAANGRRGSLHAIHLRVSVMTLRQNSWQGPVHLACGDDAGQAVAEELAAEPLAQPLTWSRIAFDPTQERAYSGKTRMQEWSPFATTVYIDADTVFLGNIDPLWATDERIVLTQFSTWTSRTRKIIGRIDSWKELVPQMVSLAHAVELPAINTGCASFTKQCRFFDIWRQVCAKAPRMFIGDESACQVLIACRKDWRYVDGRFNASPTYGPHDDVRIMHFHGAKILKKPEVAGKFAPYLNQAKEVDFAKINAAIARSGLRLCDSIPAN